MVSHVDTQALPTDGTSEGTKPEREKESSASGMQISCCVYIPMPHGCCMNAELSQHHVVRRGVLDAIPY